MSNRVTLDEFSKMKAKDASALPSAHLAMLNEDIAELKQKATALSALMATALDLKYGEKAKALRGAMGKDTGIVHIDDDDCDIVADLPKSVAWNQAHLRAMCVKIKNEWKGDVEDYISVELKVPEAKFAAWPKDLQAEFMPGRTVKAGKPTYKIEVCQEREAA